MTPEQKQYEQARIEIQVVRSSLCASIDQMARLIPLLQNAEKHATAADKTLNGMPGWHAFGHFAEQVSDALRTAEVLRAKISGAVTYTGTLGANLAGKLPE